MYEQKGGFRAGDDCPGRPGGICKGQRRGGVPCPQQLGRLLLQRDRPQQPHLHNALSITAPETQTPVACGVQYDRQPVDLLPTPAALVALAMLLCFASVSTTYPMACNTAGFTRTVSCCHDTAQPPTVQTGQVTYCLCAKHCMCHLSMARQGDVASAWPVRGEQRLAGGWEASRAVAQPLHARRAAPLIHRQALRPGGRPIVSGRDHPCGYVHKCTVHSMASQALWQSNAHLLCGGHNKQAGGRDCCRQAGKSERAPRRLPFRIHDKPHLIL